MACLFREWHEGNRSLRTVALPRPIPLTVEGERKTPSSGCLQRGFSNQGDDFSMCISYDKFIYRECSFSSSALSRDSDDPPESTALYESFGPFIELGADSCSVTGSIWEKVATHSIIAIFRSSRSR